MEKFSRGVKTQQICCYKLGETNQSKILTPKKRHVYDRVQLYSLLGADSFVPSV